MRSIIDLGEEIAELYHRDGVRRFELSGSSPLPEDERAAVRWIGGLKRILKSRQVGRISFGMTATCDHLRPRVLEALGDLGFSRASQPVPVPAPVEPEIQLPLAAS